MKTQEIWQSLGDEIYFFILKKVKSKNVTNDIFQNTFLKIHDKLDQLKEPEKLRAWVFQIARNEIFNHIKHEINHSKKTNNDGLLVSDKDQIICCLDTFIDGLPQTYRRVVKLVYQNGKKQYEVADELEISIANVKARLRRAKTMLKKQLHECCKYEYNKKGKLVGSPDCLKCMQ